MQEIFTAGEGDCFSACIASLLELPLSAVPKFRKLHPPPACMVTPARKWLEVETGLSLVTIQMAREVRTGEDLRLIGAAPGTPCMAGGVSPNVADTFHCVVGEIDEQGMNFRMTHDPHPSQKGIVGPPRHLYFLVPLGVKNWAKRAR